MPSAFFRFLAFVLIPLLWVGLPAMASAQSANGNNPDSSLSRQLQANSGQASTRISVKVTPDQPPNSFVQYGEVWGCNKGFTKSGNKCISIFSELGGTPENSYVQYGSVWGCTAGFRKEGNRCVSVFIKKKVIVKKEGKDEESLASMFK